MGHPIIEKVVEHKMSQRLAFKLIMNSQEFLLPFQFIKMTTISPNILETLIEKHQYEVQSSVSSETLQSFVDYLIKGSEPKIKMSNFHEYVLLSQEFKDQELQEIVKRENKKWNEYEKKIENIDKLEKLFSTFVEFSNKHIDIINTTPLFLYRKKRGGGKKKVG